MSVDIVRNAPADPSFPLGNGELHDLCDDILSSLGLDDGFFELRLVDDSEVAALNSSFLGCEGPTNVLSFPAREGAAEEGEDGERYLGEVALSVDTLARETRLYGQDPREHLSRLLAHAILHLAGYDHGEEMEALTELAVAAVSGEAA